MTFFKTFKTTVAGAMLAGVVCSSAVAGKLTLENTFGLSN
jgi:hypothetical protein